MFGRVCDVADERHTRGTPYVRTKLDTQGMQKIKESQSNAWVSNARTLTEQFSTFIIKNPLNFELCVV